MTFIINNLGDILTFVAAALGASAVVVTAAAGIVSAAINKLPTIDVKMDVNRLSDQVRGLFGRRQLTDRAGHQAHQKNAWCVPLCNRREVNA